MAYSYKWKGPNITKFDIVRYYDAGSLNSYNPLIGGNTWKDISGNGINGTLTNGPVYNESNNGNFVFDGANDFASCGAATAGTAECSVGVWVKTTSTATGTKYILSWGGTGTFVSQNNLGVLTGGAQAFLVCRDNAAATTVQVNSTSFSLNDGIWHNLFLVRNRRLCSLYIDGQLNNTGTAASDFGVFTNQNITICDYPSLSTFFNGSIGQVVIYGSYALTAREVLQNYNALRSRYNR